MNALRTLYQNFSSQLMQRGCFSHFSDHCKSTGLTRFIGNFQVVIAITYNLPIYIFFNIYLFLAALGLCCGVQASHCGGFSYCGAQALGALGARAQQLWLTGSRAQAQQFWRSGLVALWYVGSSQTRDRTRDPCIGRQTLNHCATREVPTYPYLKAVIIGGKN